MYAIRSYYVYVRVDIAKFSETMIDTVKIGQNGYAYMITGKGMIFSHPEKELVLKEDLSKFRITSYNVCYTKLLRDSHVPWRRRILAHPHGASVLGAGL